MNDDFQPVIGLQCPVDVLFDQEGGATIRQDQTGLMGDRVDIYLGTQETVRALAQALLQGIGDTA